MNMKFDEYGRIILTEVYSGIKLESDDGEVLHICMRDSGFEFNYQGTWYQAKEGFVGRLDEA